MAIAGNSQREIPHDSTASNAAFVPASVPVAQKPANVIVTPVAGLSDFLAFCRVPRMLYSGLPGFSPSLDAERWTLHAARLNPHFKRVKSCAWLARRNGQIVGRIVAQMYTDIRPLDVSSAQIGSLDATDDASVVAALVANAEGWLRAQGATIVHGPFSPSINSETGMLVDGFEAEPMVFMPWHPRWLGALLEQQGYSKARDLISYRYAITQRDRTAEPVVLKRPRWKERLRFRNIRLNDLKNEVAIMTDIFNDGWQDNWGFAPIGLDEFQSMADGLKFLMIEDLGFVTELDGEPVAFGIIIPNLHEMTADLGGKLLPLGLPKLIQRIRTNSYRSARLALFGIRSKLHRSTMGGVIVAGMMEELRLRSRKLNFDRIEFGWILENNRAMRHPIEKSGAKIDKIHRVYEKRLDGSAAAVVPTLHNGVEQDSAA